MLTETEGSVVSPMVILHPLISTVISTNNTMSHHIAYRIHKLLKRVIIHNIRFIKGSRLYDNREPFVKGVLSGGYKMCVVHLQHWHSILSAI